ncbi:hypothetical protein EJ02DRAFT_459402 [Clathrospora elynae]|uniref:Uncharacterized protein n=1 Tax=Clathrospora elynae TaxID=706981 RepID=A0A6A5S976_9PLEO|nr:hypothetical protein EJ02DRAFT_459402 [Clathrospora elynae]
MHFLAPNPYLPHTNASQSSLPTMYFLVPTSHLPDTKASQSPQPLRITRPELTLPVPPPVEFFRYIDINGDTIIYKFSLFHAHNHVGNSLVTENLISLENALPRESPIKVYRSSRQNSNQHTSNPPLPSLCLMSEAEAIYAWRLGNCKSPTLDQEIGREEITWGSVCGIETRVYL